MNELANKVANNYSAVSGDTEAALDPSFILVILEIIESLIAAWQNCKKTPSEALETADTPNRWEKVALRVMVRRQVGIREFRRNGEELVEALLNTGHELTLEDLEQVW